MSKTPTQNDWETRFDDEFPLHTVFWDKLATRRIELKSFIRQELADARKEVMMDIRKLRYELVVTGEGKCFAKEYIKGQTYLSLETLEKLATLREGGK